MSGGPAPARLPGLAECVRCAELAAARQRVVVGEFPAGSHLLLVGEAPGRAEDETGRPFVGRAGRLLDELLDAAGAHRPRVAVTNVVKCRPPGNRTPRRAEVRACAGWLARQVELTAPSVIVTLGATAASWAYGRPVSLSDARRSGRLLPPAAWVASYHPSAALRFGPTGAPRRELAADLARAVRLADELAGGGLALGTVGVEQAEAVHRLTVAAFRTLPPLQPPSGVFRESVADVAVDLRRHPAAAAYRGRRLVAAARLAGSGEALWLRRVAVAPEEQQRGVGTRLARWTHEWALACGYRQTRLGVRDALSGNVRFWSGLGYRAVAEHEFWTEYARELS